MTEEHKEETAALYAMDLLEGPERAAFEAELSRDPALRALVDQLRESSASLAFLAKSASPSAGLRDRVLSSIAKTPPSSAKAADTSADLPSGRVVPFPIGGWLGWAAAACFAVGMGYFGLRYVTARSDAMASRERAELAEISNKSLQQHLEAVDIVHKTQVAALQRAADVDQLKIARLVRLASDKSAAVAIAVWNPVKQEGLLQTEDLPALGADEDYQLWVIDPQNTKRPVSAGVFAAGAKSLRFRPDEPVSAAAVFAVSRERKGGSTTAKGPQGAVIATGDL